MSDSISFRYFLYDLSHPVTFRHKEWRNPISCFDPYRSTTSASMDGITHGDYFKAVKSFFEKDRFEAVLYGLFRIKQREVSKKDIEEIRVILFKHGEFYHPSRIDVSCMGWVCPMVLNVALSSAGKAVAEQEFGLLDGFSGAFFHAYLPEVFGFGEAPLGKDGIAALFLGEWFAGYHEFHPSEEADGTRKAAM